MTSFSVRAEPVEALSFLLARKEEQPFDKLRANGDGVVGQVVELQ
jgi:hypothetical protein